MGGRYSKVADWSKKENIRITMRMESDCELFTDVAKQLIEDGHTVTYRNDVVRILCNQYLSGQMDKPQSHDKECGACFTQFSEPLIETAWYTKKWRCPSCKYVMFRAKAANKQEVEKLSDDIEEAKSQTDEWAYSKKPKRTDDLFPDEGDS